MPSSSTSLHFDAVRAGGAAPKVKGAVRFWNGLDPGEQDYMTMHLVLGEFELAAFVNRQGTAERLADALEHIAAELRQHSNKLMPAAEAVDLSGTSLENE